MDSKKDNKTVRDLLPLFCVLAILLLIAQNINLTVQVSNLQIKVQNQDLRIFNLEDIYGSKENGEIVEEQVREIMDILFGEPTNVYEISMWTNRSSSNGKAKILLLNWIL